MTELAQYAVVTKAGITAAIDAGTKGPEIRITKFRIGSKSYLEGGTSVETDTDVDDFVYEGTIDQMRYSRIDDDTVVWKITLGQNVGDFDVGNIGLFLDSGIMLCKVTLPGQSAKYSSSLPEVIGNRKVYNVVLVLSNIANRLDLTLHEVLEATLAEVATQNALPDPASAPFNVYLVRNHTKIGQPVVAMRDGSLWMYRSYYAYPNQGVGVLSTVKGMVDSLVSVGSAVKYDGAARKIVLADGADPNMQPEAIYTGDSEATTIGTLEAGLLGIATPLIPGTLYYAGTGTNRGKLVTTANGRIVGLAVNATNIWVNLGSFVGQSATDDPNNYITIDPDSVDPTLRPGSVVYLNGQDRIWQRADPNDVTRRPVGLLSADKKRVVRKGLLKLPTAVGDTAWPKPLTAGTLYYADTLAAAGNVTATSTTRFIVGTAHAADAIMVKLEALAANANHLALVADSWTHTGATPSGTKAAIDEHAGGRNHPPATSSDIGLGRPSTDSEFLTFTPQPLPAYQFPWVTPQQLANMPLPPDPSNLIVLKAGSTMDNNASLTFVGTGNLTKSGSPYWHPSNDGPGSGLDADLLDGIQGDKFVRKNTNAELVANGRVQVALDVANQDLGALRLFGKTAQLGGGMLAFVDGAGTAPSAAIVADDNRRGMAGRLHSADTNVFEDQFKFTDDGDLWLRKFNKKVSELGFWVVHEATFSGVSSWTFNTTNFSIVIWSIDVTSGGFETVRIGQEVTTGDRGVAPKHPIIHMGSWPLSAEEPAVPATTGMFIRTPGTNIWESADCPGPRYGANSGTSFSPGISEDRYNTHNGFGHSTGNTFTILPAITYSFGRHTDGSSTLSGKVRLIMLPKGAI